MRKTKITLSVKTGESREYKTLENLFKDLRFWFHSGEKWDNEDELADLYKLCKKYYTAKFSVLLSGITFTFEQVPAETNDIRSDVYNALADIAFKNGVTEEKMAGALEWFQDRFWEEE